MSDPQVWLFRQVGGSKKTLTLSGYSAPFGRPREKAVVRERIGVRQKTIRYPGSDGPPTRHIFGDTYEPWELQGRFSWREGGTGYANSRAKELADFVRDKQEVAIAWGSITSARGFIEWVEFGRESSEEIEWKLHILIDEDDTATVPQPMPTPASPKDQMATMTAALNTITKLQDPTMFRPSFLDVLSAAIGALTTILAVPQQIVGQLSSLEQAVAGDIQRLRAGLGQLRTAYLNFRDLLWTTQDDAITIGQSFSTDASVGGLFAKVDVDTMYALAAIVDLDNQAVLVQNGMLITSTIARAGDTWESISIRCYGAPDRADQLRQANGVRGSQQPVPGQTYQVPQAL